MHMWIDMQFKNCPLTKAADCDIKLLILFRSCVEGELQESDIKMQYVYKFEKDNLRDTIFQ